MTKRGPVKSRQAEQDVRGRCRCGARRADRLFVARGLFTGVSAQVADEMYTRIRGRGIASATR